MGIKRPKTASQIDKYINTDFDKVQIVADNMEALIRVSESISEVVNNIKVKYVATPDGLSVAFQNKTTFTSGSIASVHWDFGDASESTDNDVTHVYSTAGAYNVTLTITDDLGSTNVLTHSITVQLHNLAPVVNFTETISYNEVTFSNGSVDGDGSIAAYQWEFGDGNAALTENPIYLYRAEGNYVVRLTVTDNRGLKAFKEKAINIAVLPEFDVAPRCAYSTDADDAERDIQFTDESMGVEGYTVIGWLWTFGDGSTSTDQHPLHTYTTSGNYSAILAVTDDNGKEAVCSNNVAAFMLPVVSFTEADVGRELTFTDTSTSVDGTINAWLWDFGDGGSSILQNPVHNYALAGSYDVVLTVTNALSDSATSAAHTLAVNALPVPMFSFLITNGELDATFTDESTDANGTVATWAWDFGDGNTSTVQNPTHTYASTGDYTVTLSLTDDLGDSSLVAHSVLVGANLKPVASFDTTFLSLTYNFTDTSTDVGGSIAAWSWNFGDGTPLVTTQNPQHIYAADGDFDVTLIVTDNKGATHFATNGVLARDIIFVDGTTGDDTLTGTAADETIRMFDGVDTFNYALGDGTDVLDASGLGTKTLNFTDIAKEDLAISRLLKSIILTASDGGSVTIPDFYSTDTGYAYGTGAVDVISFTNGDESITVLMVGTENADTLAATSANEDIYGQGGNDTITAGTSSGGRQSNLYGGAGDDNIQAKTSGTEITGGTGNDTIRRQSDSGHDVIYYNIGDGFDTIDYYNGVSSGSVNKSFEIVFGAGITPDDLTGANASNYSTMSLSGTPIIRCYEWLDPSDVRFKPTQITFASGYVMSQADYIDLIAGTYFAPRDVLGTTGDDNLVLTKGTSYVYPDKGTDTITKAADGDDIIYYNLGDANLSIDYHQGTPSANRSYSIVLGAGMEVANLRFIAMGVLDTDEVQLNINNSGVITMLHGNNPNFPLLPTTVTLNDGTVYTLAQIRSMLITGTTGDDVLMGNASDNVIDGNSGTDTLSGGAGNDTLDGGKGTDTLHGGTGSNTYLYSRADGQDTIYPGDDDTLIIDATFPYADSAWLREGNDLTIRDVTQGTKIYFKDHFNGANQMSNVQFLADGLTIGKADFDAVIAGTFVVPIIGTENADNITLANQAGVSKLYGLGGDDTLTGKNGSGSNVIHGGEGNDTISAPWTDGVNEYYGDAGNDDITVGMSTTNIITGGTGDDTINRTGSGTGIQDIIHYSLGDGNDTMYYYGGEDANKQFNLHLHNIVIGDLTARNNGTAWNSDAFIDMPDGDTMRIRNYTTNGAYSITFDNGFTMDAADVQSWFAGTFSIPVFGTDNADTLTTHATEDSTIFALGGDDTITTTGTGTHDITGGKGNDAININTGSVKTFHYAFGDGQDEMEGWALDTSIKTYHLVLTGITLASMVGSTSGNQAKLTFADGGFINITDGTAAKYSPTSVTFDDGVFDQADFGDFVRGNYIAPGSYIPANTTYSAMPDGLGSGSSTSASRGLARRGNTVVSIESSGYAARSDSLGDSWVGLPKGLNSGSVSANFLALDVTDDGYWLAAADGAKLAQSTDDGITWTQVVVGGGFVADATNSVVGTGNTMIVGNTSNQLATTIDAGVTWAVTLLPNANAGNMQSSAAEGDDIVIGTDNGHAIISRDKGVTWNVLRAASSSSPITAIGINAGVIILGDNTGLAVRSDDYGSTWTTLTAGFNSTGTVLTAIENIDVKTSIASYEGGHAAMSVDKGLTWTRLAGGLGAVDNTLNINRLVNLGNGEMLVGLRLSKFSKVIFN